MIVKKKKKEEEEEEEEGRKVATARATGYIGRLRLLTNS